MEAFLRYEIIDSSNEKKEICPQTNPVLNMTVMLYLTGQSRGEKPAGRVTGYCISSEPISSLF